MYPVFMTSKTVHQYSWSAGGIINDDHADWEIIDERFICRLIETIQNQDDMMWRKYHTWSTFSVLAQPGPYSLCSYCHPVLGLLYIPTFVLLCLNRPYTRTNEKKNKTKNIANPATHIQAYNIIQECYECFIQETTPQPAAVYARAHKHARTCSFSIRNSCAFILKAEHSKRKWFYCDEQQLQKVRNTWISWMSSDL